MSLIYKHHLILPEFKLNETIPFQNSQSNNNSTLKSSQKTLTTQRALQEKILPVQHSLIENNDFSLPPIRKANSNERPKLPLSTIRSNASDEKTIKDYLDHLNTLRSQKNTQRQTKFKKVKTETEIVQYGDLKFKRVKENTSKKSIAVFLNIKNPQSQSYIKFSQQIYELNHNLSKLKDYINNDRKLFQVIKQLIGLRKNLRKVMLKQNGDELIDFQDISKMCCVREIQYVFGEQKVVDKFDLSLYDDLAYLTDMIGNLLLQNEIQYINRISENITKETQQVQKIQSELGMGEDEQKLSVQTLPMKRFKIHDEIEQIEQKLGPMQLISKQVRQTSMVLSKVISGLND
ncbi:unnamed protein product (macronuclear) [Paramecium tetraurelia]|uniref:Uncharacterized protein n=1 Tax=Paramecium tetraurelia TaxID=5888 RepID=A0DES8_PARTE|nr:uncharacterized protein GSPATT00016371001 [Paramecium tetraurelia]CAK81545.1 unnamed protein product [Paramecium tetraurelia]|eukprot:XP_001448942.1 hypothetical protein (macronuclear) [Paramecium tetraurelia strain d4-2]